MSDVPTAKRRAWIFIALILSVVVAAVVMSNTVGLPNPAEYGRLNSKTTKVLTLPAGTILVGYAGKSSVINGQRGNVVVPPDVTLSIDPVAAGGAAPSIKRTEQDDSRYSDNQADSQRTEWTVQIPAAGRYRVTAGGGLGAPDEYVLGSPAPISFWGIWIVAAVALLAVVGCWIITAMLRRKRPHDVTRS